MRPRLVPCAVILSLSIMSCAPGAALDIEQRIRSVEDGLLKKNNDPLQKRMKLADRMKHYNVPGVSIALINDFKVEWAKGYGIMEARKDRPVTPDTLFQAASVSKPVVAAAVLRLVEAGRLELDESVNDKLASWKVPENKFTTEEKVTLRRLLSHSAGVTVHGFRGYAQGEKIPSFLQILDGRPPANSAPIRVDIVPGTKYRYSGGGFLIVQQLVMDVLKKRFPEIMQETVLGPLGMTSSTFEMRLPENLAERAAAGHRRNGRPIVGKWHTHPEMAAASLWTTPSDLARFAIEIMRTRTGESGTVLPKRPVDEMLTPQIGNYGLGLAVIDDGRDLFHFMHTGANEGYRCVLVGYPERGQGVVIMTNGDNGEALWEEILRSVSVEYGWVRDSTTP
ncbi:MAG: serine hydrolase domain-containing protein [bacterium]|nr:serine hydrolase domain-containing protein [bacterium]